MGVADGNRHLYDIDVKAGDQSEQCVNAHPCGGDGNDTCHPQSDRRAGDDQVAERYCDEREESVRNLNGDERTV